MTTTRSGRCSTGDERERVPPASSSMAGGAGGCETELSNTMFDNVRVVPAADHRQIQRSVRYRTNPQECPPERTDARVIRTRAAVFEALTELIQHKRWERITVRDILERAGISRSTFYSHYENKLDVLTGGIPDVASTIVVTEAGHVDLRPLFEHIEEVGPIVYPLLSQTVLGDIAMTFENAFSRAFEQIIDPDRAPHLARFLAGGLIAIIRSHGPHRQGDSSEAMATELGAYINQLITNTP